MNFQGEMNFTLHFSYPCGLVFAVLFSGILNFY